MKSTQRVLLLALAFIAGASACHAASPVWRIESGNQHLYLGGTVHLLRASDYPLPDAFDRAYADADIVVFESDTSSSAQAEFQHAMMQATLLPEQQTLADVLAPATITQLNDHLRRNNLSERTFQRMRPGMIAMTLTLIELRKLGVTSAGVDQHYFQRANREGKPTQFLETLQQQLDFLTVLDEGIEDEVILHTLQELEQLADQYDDMLSSWRRGDRRGLTQLFVTPMREQFPAVYRVLLEQRNQAWLTRIDEYLDSPQTELLLVGSAHLIGSDGLLQRLAAKGLRVVQLD